MRIREDPHKSSDNMEKYGLRLHIDAANLPVVIQTTVRPPFETLVQQARKKNDTWPSSTQSIAKFNISSLPKIDRNVEWR